jgi:hypothetical protein
MSQLNNIEEFNKCAAVVLEKLYDSFPVPVELDAHRLQEFEDEHRALRVSEDQPQGLVFNDSEIEEILCIYHSTIQFLIDEGFVRDVHREHLDKLMQASGELWFADNMSKPAIFPKLVLTAKGLTVLNKVPPVIEGKPSSSFIQQIRNALSSSSKEVLREVMRNLISHSVPYLVSHVPNLL